MSQDYYPVKGQAECFNFAMNEFLAKITLGLWDKVGIPRPLSEEDAKLVARILRNYVHLQRITAEDKKEDAFYFWHRHGNYVQDQPSIIKFIGRVANFFENCGGLITEAEWNKAHQHTDGGGG